MTVKYVNLAVNLDAPEPEAILQPKQTVFNANELLVISLSVIQNGSEKLLDHWTLQREPKCSLLYCKEG